MNARLGVIADGISRDVKVAAQTARAAGLESIEYQFLWEWEAGDAGMPAHKRKLARDVAADNGLAVSCVSRHIFARQFVSAEVSSAEYREQMDALKRCAEFAHELGAGLVRTMSFRRETILFGGGGAEKWIVANGAWDKLRALFEEPLRLAERENISLVVETGNGTMINSAQMMSRLIDDMGGNRLRALWDPCNCLYCGEKPEPDGINALPGAKMGHVHIKDAIVRPPQSTVNFCELGTGDMAPHLQNIADTLRAQNYSGDISLESTYRPEGKDFADGFAASAPLFKKIYGAV